jgi:hypothetical protein
VGVRGAMPRGGENRAERGAGVWRRMDQHGTDVAASGCSDSGGRHVPTGRGCDRGGRWGRERLTGGARWQWLGVGGSASERGSTVSGADSRGWQHSAAGAVLNRFNPVQTDSNLLKL